MPPKAKKEGPSKKNQEKAKDKTIEDKTFGLKNKKGTKQQKFIKTVTTQVKSGGKGLSRLEQQIRDEREKKKEEKKKMQDELNTLFRPVQNIGKGVDPKSVLCAFFKQGQCTKGDKCKFSHDLTIERKSEKRSLYDEKANEDNMANWDEATLNDVIMKKHGEAEKAMPKTAIICKHFLEAVENSKYGWFWNCPNGKNCFYRHALPPGFILKKDQKKGEEKLDQISLEDLIERERAALGSNVTKICLATFLAWKERKRKEKIAAMMADQQKKKTDFKAGKIYGISGRQMFEFNPELMTADDDGDDDDAGVYASNQNGDNDEDDDEGVVHEVSLDYITSQAANSGTQAPIDRWQGSGEAGKLDEACAIDPSTQAQIDADAAIAMAVSATVNGDAAADMPIDEDLFAGDDIDLVEEDLETFDLSD